MNQKLLSKKENNLFGLIAVEEKSKKIACKEDQLFAESSLSVRVKSIKASRKTAKIKIMKERRVRVFWICKPSNVKCKVRGTY